MWWQEPPIKVPRRFSRGQRLAGMTWGHAEGWGKKRKEKQQANKKNILHILWVFFWRKEYLWVIHTQNHRGLRAAKCLDYRHFRPGLEQPCHPVRGIWEFPQDHLHCMSNCPALQSLHWVRSLKLNSLLRHIWDSAWKSPEPDLLQKPGAPIPESISVKSLRFSNSFVKAEEGSKWLCRSQTLSAAFSAR